MDETATNMMEQRLDQHWYIGACPHEMLPLPLHPPGCKEAWAESLNDK